MYDLVVNLVASVIAGTAVWLAQFLLRHRRRATMRAFFGLDEGSECLLVVSRHASSQRANSVHVQDVAALVELATVARECGADSSVVAASDAPREVGRVTEFSVGGPEGNPRAASHLETFLPSVRFDSFAESDDEMVALWVGPRAFRSSATAEFAVLARTPVPGRSRPIFIVAGQRARTNFAAARYLSSHHRELRRRHGASGRFCVVLEISRPDSYGSDVVRVAADVTDEAFRALAVTPDVSESPM